ncbi:MAG: XRE family transcriptional regulator [Hyphomicrobiales bacterium]|nr:MAG: XRE family transcriptional regulator [Hyphomicrobiales bacterium]
MDIRKLVGRNVARIRKSIGLTQEQLAERCALSQQYLSGIEQGQRNPTLLILDRLARALEVRLSHLVEVDAPAHPQGTQRSV